MIEADIIEDKDDNDAISTKGLSAEELENLVKQLDKKLRKEKRRADRESVEVEAMRELIGTAEKTFKIDILKKPVARQ